MKTSQELEDEMRPMPIIFPAPTDDWGTPVAMYVMTSQPQHRVKRAMLVVLTACVAFLAGIVVALWRSHS